MWTKLIDLTKGPAFILNALGEYGSCLLTGEQTLRLNTVPADFDMNNINPDNFMLFCEQKAKEYSNPIVYKFPLEYATGEDVTVHFNTSDSIRDYNSAIFEHAKPQLLKTFKNTPEGLYLMWESLVYWHAKGILKIVTPDFELQNHQITTYLRHG